MSDRWSSLVARAHARRGSRRLLNIAHRGARAVAPENTVEAIEQAAILGADMVEIDVHLTTDGALVVTHDFEPQVSLAAIRQKSARTPTLAECLTRALELDLLVNVEVKNLPRRYADIEQKILAEIDRLGARRDVILSSFDHELVVSLRRLDAGVATAVLTRDRLYDAPSYLARVDADALHIETGLLDRSLVQEVRATGRGVNLWTENNRDRMALAIEAGVTGIFTDYPDRLRDLLGWQPGPPATR
jgi:glycerophosphoryl diester phosphodiesterase